MRLNFDGCFLNLPIYLKDIRVVFYYIITLLPFFLTTKRKHLKKEMCLIQNVHTKGLSQGHIL